MPNAATNADDQTISLDLVNLLIREHHASTRPALNRLWDYYRNELDFTRGDEKRPYAAAQQQGLPHRLTHAPGEHVRTAHVGGGRREVVIENDIAWRIHTLVDFMFAKPVRIQSLAADPQKAAAIELALNTVIDASGGPCFYQDMALLGAVYGFVDLMLRTDALTFDGSSTGIDTGSAPSKSLDTGRIARIASKLQLETVEAPRAIPVLDPSDYRQLAGYILHYTQTLNRVESTSLLANLVDFRGRPRNLRQQTVEVTELWTADRISIYHDNSLVSDTPNLLGVLPVVHVQNLAQPFFYEGLSEVEPLIPLQDELNTRLSDRANRVTLQSFKMYLGKGIDRFTERPIAPGQMWMTDNEAASIEEFGGDASAPSEDAHIAQTRQALDKTSGVSPVAAGIIAGGIGNLTSENALRVVLMGLLAKTERKRVTYGKGIARACELVLHALDLAGALPTTPDERRVALHWPSPIPEDQTQRLNDALLKLKLGVPQQQILTELGYDGEIVRQTSPQ